MLLTKGKATASSSGSTPSLYFQLIALLTPLLTSWNVVVSELFYCRAICVCVWVCWALCFPSVFKGLVLCLFHLLPSPSWIMKLGKSSNKTDPSTSPSAFSSCSQSILTDVPPTDCHYGEDMYHDYAVLQEGKTRPRWCQRGFMHGLPNSEAGVQVPVRWFKWPFKEIMKWVNFLMKHLLLPLSSLEALEIELYDISRMKYRTPPSLGLLRL